MGYLAELTKGLFKRNPTFVIVLGLCPTLAITTSLENAIGMGLSTLFVLIFSELFISLIRNIIPENVRIPVFIVIIATFVTIVQMTIKAYLPSLDDALGIFIPLIVVNCIIFSRIEEYASKNPPLYSILDAIGMGLGFTLAISLISIIREALGTGKISILGDIIGDASLPIEPMMFFILAPGALLTMGLLLAFFQWLEQKKEAKESKEAK